MKLINEVKRMQQLAGINTEATDTTPSDVKNLAKATATNTSMKGKTKVINNTAEFPGAFETWFNTLGYQPGKLTIMTAKNAVGEVLKKLGYK